MKRLVFSFTFYLWIVRFASYFNQSLSRAKYDRSILARFFLYSETERDGKNRSGRKSDCTRAGTGSSVNGWMNLGEKGCLWAAESVAARLINEALARGPEEDQQQLRYQGGELIDRYPLPTYLSTHLSINHLPIERRMPLLFASIVN